VTTRRNGGELMTLPQVAAYLGLAERTITCGLRKADYLLSSSAQLGVSDELTLMAGWKPNGRVLTQYRRVT